MQGQGRPENTSNRSLAALVATLAVLALMLVAGLGRAQGAEPRQDPTPVPTYPIPPTPTPTPTPIPTPTAAPTSPALMKPFPTVRTAGNYNRRRTRFTRVKVTGPAGATVEGRCTRIARKCHTNVTIPRRQTVRLKRLQRKFRPKTVIRIRVIAPGVYGKYVVIKIRKGKPPVRRDRCVKPGTRKSVACPSS